MACSLPGSSVHGISQARMLEWVAISFSWGSSDAVLNLHLLLWQADSSDEGLCFLLPITGCVASDKVDVVFLCLLLALVSSFVNMDINQI